MRILAIVLAVAACSSPCPLVCTSSSDCPAGTYCLNNSACLQDCLRCPLPNGNCVDSFSNCGACGNACADGQVCILGTSSTPPKCGTACAAGTTKCGIGSCYDLMTDRAHCGSCEVLCAPDSTCVAGKCTKVDVCQ